VFDWFFGASSVIREGQVGLVYRDGVYDRQLGPGRHRIGMRELLTPVSIAPQLIVVSGQEVLSADGFQPRLTAVTSFTVTDAHRAVSSHDAGYREMLLLELQIALRTLAAIRPAEDLIRIPRATLDAELLAAVHAPASALGLAVVSVRLRDVILPADLRRLLTGVEKARREGQVALERAHAEQAALRSLANAARMLRNNPELQNLRLIQALAEGKGATVVLGSPTGLVPLREGPTDPG
jgi:regulator of protease activity HflC (stomatin/prohibitin superfamily)